MNPQGSNIINLDQYEKLGDDIDKVGSCAELQATAQRILTSLYAENSAIQEQLDTLAPIAALLEAPASIDDVVDWITGLITGVLEPLYAPALAYPTQIAARTVAITDLITKINDKANQFQSCSLTLPTPP
jgi:hypothetical protein